MKKILCLFAVMATLALTAGFMSSCKEKVTSTYMFHVTVSFNDNMDILTYAIDEGFKEAGFTQSTSAHYWMLIGEQKECHQKAITTFQNRCKAIDKDRKLISSSTGFALGEDLALKGESATLVVGFSGEEEEISKYTFVENDPE